MGSFTINFHRSCAVIIFRGDLGYDNIDNLEQSIEQSIAKGIANIVFDCENLTFISSSDVTIFVKFYNMCKTAGGSFGISSANLFIKNVINKSGISTLLKFYKNEQDAFRNLSVSPERKIVTVSGKSNCITEMDAE